MSLDQGRRRYPDLRTYILGGGEFGPVIRIRDVGDDDMHWEGVGRIPPHGGPKADRETTLDREGWNVDIPPASAIASSSGG